MSGAEAAGEVPDAVAGDMTLVAELKGKDPEALGSLFTRYGDRLYSYAITMLKDPHAAGDAAQESLVIAFERIEQLRDPTKLRPWLYAICRSVCLRDLRERKRVLPADAFEATDSGQIDQSAAATDAQAAQALVAAAMVGLADRDREVLELALRHDLQNSEIAAAMGTSEGSARSRLSRARSQLELSIGALLLYQSGSRDCPTLARIVSRGEFTPLMRKRIVRHYESCAVCGHVRSRAVSAVALASLPLLALPAGYFAVANNPAEQLAVSASIPLDGAGWPTTVQGTTIATIGTGKVVAAGVAVVAVIGMLVTLSIFGSSESTPATQTAVVGETSASPIAGADPTVYASRPAPRRRGGKTDGGVEQAKPQTLETAEPIEDQTSEPIAIRQPGRAVEPSAPRPTPTRNPTPTRTPTLSATPTPTLTLTPEPTPTNDCWRYDPSAGPDYIPGGPPPECMP